LRIVCIGLYVTQINKQEERKNDFRYTRGGHHILIAKCPGTYTYLYIYNFSNFANIQEGKYNNHFEELHDNIVPQFLLMDTFSMSYLLLYFLSNFPAAGN
jgi:hypothetical protein